MVTERRGSGRGGLWKVGGEKFRYRATYHKVDENEEINEPFEKELDVLGHKTSKISRKVSENLMKLYRDKNVTT